MRWSPQLDRCRRARDESRQSPVPDGLATYSAAVRWAILGTGFISNTVAEAIAAHEGSEVEIVAGRNADRVAHFQAQHSIARGTTSFSEAIADHDVDAVYVATPNHYHHPLVIEAAAANKAILSEKSLTTTMESAHELATAVRDRVLFAEGLMYLTHPVANAFADILRSGSIGEIQAVHGLYAANIAAVVNPLGRGTIYNLGCYPASLLHLVIQTAFGPEAFGQRTLTATGIATSDDTIGAATASIAFANGVTATLSSTDNYGMAYKFSVLTDTGELRFETNPWLPVAGENVISWHPYDEPSVVHTVVDKHDAFFHQVRIFEAAAGAGRTELERPSPRLNDSLEIMELLTEWEQCCLR